MPKIGKDKPLRDIDRELAFHFDEKVEDLVHAGLTRDMAQLRAHEEFGNVEATRRTLGDIGARTAQRKRRAGWWEAVLQDVSYVLRTIRRAPGFSIAVVATLALGLGANTAVFSLLERLFLHLPTGVLAPEQLHRVYKRGVTARGEYLLAVFSYPEIRTLREVAPGGMQLAGYTAGKISLGAPINAHEVGTAYCEGDYFGVVGVTPSRGRFFDSTEMRIDGRTPVAVISHHLWTTRFSQDPDMVGRTIDAGSRRFTVVGVAPVGFRGTDMDVVDLWLPMNTLGTWNGRAADWYEARSSRFIRPLSRVSDDGTMRLFAHRATLALRAMTQGGDTQSSTFLGSIIEAREDDRHDREERIITRLAGVSVLILIIAIANVANLLVARALNRRREIALRLALGVSRRRLVAQLMTESLVLAMTAGIVAWTVALVGSHALKSLLLPDVDWGGLRINSRVAWFTVTSALLTGVAAGLVPALHASRPDLARVLRGSSRGASYSRSRLRMLLVMTQSALSVLLLAGAGAFAMSLNRIEGVDVGYATDRLVFAEVDFDRELDNRRDDIARRLPDVAERVREIPGVERVALAAATPFREMVFSDILLAGQDSLPAAARGPTISSQVSPEYFAATGMRVLRGRDFNERDRSGAPMVVVLNEHMAHNLFPNEDPLTQCIVVGKRGEPCRQVVGIVSNTHFYEVIEPSSMQFYTPLAQASAAHAGKTIVVRAAPTRSRQVARDINQLLQQEYGSWARPQTHLLSDELAPQLRPWKVGAVLFSAAGLLALVVAATGVFCSISYAVSQRSHELGVRMALGAQGRDIARMVVGEGVRVAGMGAVVGLLAVISLGGVVQSLLYETTVYDPALLLGVTVLLLSVAGAAALIPALRASQASPVEALRQE